VLHPLLDLPYAALEREMTLDGLSPVHARPLWQSWYRDIAPETLLPPIQRWLASRAFTPEWPEVALERNSGDGLTRKFLLRLADGETIETVLMQYEGRATACLSTQVGCAMGCVFCATGQRGFTRHLRPSEIVAQVLQCQRMTRAQGGTELRNLVLMGMGEPLHNYEAVMEALDIMTDDRGINLGPRRITISTVGIVPGIRRMAEEQRPYNLAVSLHGATDADRTALVPVGQRWPLVELMDACREYGARTGKRIFFEWTLIEGKNDGREQARDLIALMQGLDAHVNLIPLNPTGGFGGRATEETEAYAFHGWLKEAGIPCTVRQYRGIDVAAGCGQLAGTSR
jgi:23S rRNA (adenine2503-C2)-methyltransferase